MRRYLLATLVIALAVAVMTLTPVVASAADPTLTVTVIGADNKPLADAKVTVYDVSGNKYTNTTDANGVASVTVPANGTYLVVVNSKYYILATVDVAGDTSATINASTMHHANISSTPTSVEATVVLLDFNSTKLKLNTNVTVYAPSSINVTYPKEVVKFPFKYVFDKVTYGSTETNSTTVTIDMATDYDVVAHYTKTFFLALSYWAVIALVVIVIAALAIAWVAGSKTAKAMIAEWRERNRKFVKKKRR